MAKFCTKQYSNLENKFTLCGNVAFLKVGAKIRAKQLPVKEKIERAGCG